MSGSQTCPDCGSPIGHDAAPEKLCPRCLLLRGLRPEASGEPDDDATVAMPADAEVRGATVGPYEIIEKLGEGGMGIVYLAEQREPIRRRVALKLIKLGMDSREVITRFESERQALALMSHPNIAQVLDAGTTEDGRPFFVMEYVEGAAITDYCDQHRLSTRRRLELFRQACRGIQHAHQKGVIHRDIKPSNVLVTSVDGEPSVKIIDFGIAKALGRPLAEKAAFTSIGQLVGTPEYMSPEQMDFSTRDIDTRTDVYSLSVLLYELLVGVLPFDPRDLRDAGFSEMMRVVREESPPRPSERLTKGSEAIETAARLRETESPTLRRQLRGDLDWIVMKALDKERGRRYASPSELEADIGRYLQDEPVLAGPPSKLYRAKKFVRRHRMAVNAVVLILGLLGIVGSSYFLELKRDRDWLHQQLIEDLNLARFLLNDLGRNLLAAGDIEGTTALTDRLRDHVAPLTTREAFQRWARTWYGPVNVLVRVEVIDGWAAELSGDPKAALAHYQEAAAQFDERIRSDPPESLGSGLFFPNFEYANLLLEESELLTGLGRAQEALQRVRAAREAVRAEGSWSSGGLRLPKNEELELDGRLAVSAGNALLEVGSIAGAVEEYSTALEAGRRLRSAPKIGWMDARFAGTSLLAQGRAGMASAHHEGGETEKAIDALEEALRIQREAIDQAYDKLQRLLEEARSAEMNLQLARILEAAGLTERASLHADRASEMLREVPLEAYRPTYREALALGTRLSR